MVSSSTKLERFASLPRFQLVCSVTALLNKTAQINCLQSETRLAFAFALVLFVGGGKYDKK